jgi:hypothetical protein
MAERAALEARVESILAQTQQRSGVTAMDVLKITATGFVAVAALAFACPSLAQDVPSTPSAIAAPPAPVMQSDLPAPMAAPAALPAPAALADVPAPPAPPRASVAAAPHHNYQHVHIDDDRDTADGHDQRHIHFLIDGHRVDLDTDDYASLPAEDRAKFDRAEAEARAHVEAMRPQIEAATAQARAAAQEAARAYEREARSQVETARAQARVAENESRIQAREAEMQAREAERAIRAEKPRIEYAVRDAGPQIEKAIEDARAEIAKANIDVKVQEKIDRALQRVEVETRVREVAPVDPVVVTHADGDK